jgi:hypothetical protein
MRHLSEQFSQILDDVAGSFPDIEYGPNANMVRVGGLHLPVSKGIIAKNEEHDLGGMTLFTPHESGEMYYMSLHPGMQFSASNNAYTKHTFSPDEFVDQYMSTNTPAAQDRDFNADTLSKHMDETQGGRMVQARFWPTGGKRSDERIFDFDLGNREIVGEQDR